MTTEEDEGGGEDGEDFEGDLEVGEVEVVEGVGVVQEGDVDGFCAGAF